MFDQAGSDESGGTCNQGNHALILDQAFGPVNQS